MKMEKKNVAAYVRVSTVEQAQTGLSLQAQKDLLSRYAADHNMNIVEFYADEGKSASKSLDKRTEILRLLNDAEIGRFSVVLFKDITRWSRNAAQYYRVQERLDKSGVSWIAVEQPYLETVTPTGKFQVSVMLGTSQLEADQTGQRIKFTQDAEVLRGYFPFPAHCAPYGYTTEKRDGHNRLIIDPKSASDIRALYDEFLRTGNASQIGRKIGIPHFNLLRTLRNRIYIGEFRGIPHFCEPIVSEDVFNRTQALMKHHSYTPKKHRYIFSGLAVCGYCGSKMKWNSPNDKYPMCRCVNCLGNTITEREMEHQVLDQIEAELDRYYVEFNNKEQRRAPRSNIEGRMNRLKDLYIDGLIDRAEFDRRRAEYAAALEVPPAPPVLPQSWRVLYDGLTKEQKNVAWKSTFQSVIVKDKHVIISFESAKVLAERMATSLRES